MSPLFTFKCYRWRSQLQWISGLCGYPFCDFNALEPFVHVNVDGQIFRDVLQCWPPPPLPVLHTQTFRSEGAQFQILSLLHCYTNRLAGARGQFAIGVCVCVTARAHTFTRADMCVTLPVGMWACGSHSGMLARMCRFVHYLYHIK